MEKNLLKKHERVSILRVIQKRKKKTNITNCDAANYCCVQISTREYF